MRPFRRRNLGAWAFLKTEEPLAKPPADYARGTLQRSHPAPQGPGQPPKAVSQAFFAFFGRAWPRAAARRGWMSAVAQQWAADRRSALIAQKFCKRLIYMKASRWSKSGVLDRVFAALQREQILRVKVEHVSLDSTSVGRRQNLCGISGREFCGGCLTLKGFDGRNSSCRKRQQHLCYWQFLAYSGVL
jgi:hypothetical protein